MKSLTIAERVQKLGLVLPKPVSPIGDYVASRRINNVLYISGQLPIRDSKVLYAGKLGLDISVQQGIKAATLCALNVISQINDAVHSESVSILKVEGFINSTESFIDHATVLDGASDVLNSVFGSSPGHIRTVLGCSSLPKNSAVELVVTAVIE
ncbi:RidA family protein [Vibrio harveyi]|uniref:RidA family protein n=1 Tax=Vibrio harveyi TaxID=669 RepID=UPI002480D2DA|nr:RidA family protein [Vibrio harveyi]HDM8173120.1 RidA family protein [Vibrio harveyi]